MKTIKMTPRQVKSSKTRNKIYNNALALFLEKGFDEVTVDEIVAKTNTSKGAFYNHFKSKNDIIIEKVKEFDEYCLQLKERFSNNLSAKEKLQAFIEVAGSFPEIKEYSLDLIRVVYSTQVKYSGKEDSFLVDKTRPSRMLLKEIIEDGQNNGEITKELSTDYIVEIINRCIMATIIDWCLYNGTYKYSKNLEEFILTIIFPCIFR